MLRYTAILPLASLCLAAEVQPALPASHQEFSTALLELLAQTEQSLASCTDAASTEAALPRLRELAERARQLAAHQASLPEPTVQDYMAAHPHVGEFNRLMNAIDDHIDRLEAAHLLSPALRELLHIAPKGE